MDGVAVIVAFASAFAQSVSTIIGETMESTINAAGRYTAGLILVLITGLLLPERYITSMPIEWLFYIGVGASLVIGRLCLTL